MKQPPRQPDPIRIQVIEDEIEKIKYDEPYPFDKEQAFLLLKTILLVGEKTGGRVALDLTRVTPKTADLYRELSRIIDAEVARRKQDS